MYSENYFSRQGAHKFNLSIFDELKVLEGDGFQFEILSLQI